MTWVFNASPLIILGKIGHLDLLPKFKNDFLIPQAVVDELVAGPAGDQAAIWVRSSLLPISSPQKIELEVLSWDLGAGESAVISCCRQLADSMAILDDRAARNCAATFSLPFMGTLGVLLRAKHEGLISSLKPEIGPVLKAGSHLSPNVIQKILELAGEA